MERMLLYTFYILPSRRGLIMLSDLASSLTVLQVCTTGGNHDFGVGMGTLGKGNLSTCCPQPSVLWSGIDQGKCQALDHLITAIWNGRASDGALERHLLSQSSGSGGRPSLNMYHLLLRRASQVVLVAKILAANTRDLRDSCIPWVRKTPWRRACQPTPIFLPRESDGQRKLVGYSPWVHKELDRRTEAT